MGFSNVDDQDITKDYFRASEELVVLVAFITSGSGSAMMLAATSWFFAFDLYKLKIEEGRCPPESLFWTNHAFSLSLSHQRGQGGSSLALHSIFKNRIPSEFAQKLPSCSIEFYSTYLIPSFSYVFSFF